MTKYNSAMYFFETLCMKMKGYYYHVCGKKTIMAHIKKIQLNKECMKTC